MYMYTRQAFQKIVDGFADCCDHLILVGHLKETLINKEGKEFSASDIDLSGKNKSITAGDADAIGYLYRKNNQCILSFNPKDEVLCGARSAHLRNVDIVLTEYDKEKNTFVDHWDQIYVKQ